MAHGQYVDGVWKTEWHDTASTGGRFKRTEPKFRNWVTPDGSAGTMLCCENGLGPLPQNTVVHSGGGATRPAPYTPENAEE